MDEWFNDVCRRSPLYLWLFDDANECDWWTDIDMAVRCSQHHIQRKNHAVFIVQTCIVVTGLVVERDVMRAGMRVGDHVLVAVEPRRPMDVPHRRQRQYADCQTEQRRQKGKTHYAECYAMRLSSATED